MRKWNRWKIAFNYGATHTADTHCCEMKENKTEIHDAEKITGAVHCVV